MKTVVVDLDGTLTFEGGVGVTYDKVSAREPEIQRVREFAQLGFRIAIYTSRNMRTFQNSIGRINAITVPGVVEWLKQHNVPFDELHVGKPWCGEGGFYVDDKALRPSELLRLSYAEVMDVLANERGR